MTFNKQLRRRVEYIRIFNEHPLLTFSAHRQSQGTHIRRLIFYANTYASSRNLKYHDNINEDIRSQKLS